MQTTPQHVHLVAAPVAGDMYRIAEKIPGGFKYWPHPAMPYDAAAATANAAGYTVAGADFPAT